MLPVVAVEALLFMSRRDLDKMCAVGTRLEALIAVACGTYPFRPMRQASLLTEQQKVHDDDKASISVFAVSLRDDSGERVHRAFATLDEALTFLAPFFRRSYVNETFYIGLRLGDWNYRVSPRQWTDLTNVFRSGAAHRLYLRRMDLSVLGDSAFVDAVRCRRLEVSYCDFRGGLLSGDVLRSCAANGVLDLTMWANKCEEEYAVSEDALLEYCFPANGSSCVIELDNLPVSDTFAAKFIERLLAPGCTSRPRECLKFAGTTEQRGLAAYAQHLVPDQENPTYRFETLRDGDRLYHFTVDYGKREDIPVLRNKMLFIFGYFDPDYMMSE